MIVRTALVAAVVVMSATGCGDEPPSAEAQGRWVDAFCAGMVPGLQAGLELKAQNADDPAAVKAAYVKLVTANATGLAEAEKKLTELGPPADLADVHAPLVQYFGESARSYAAAQAPVQALPADAQFWENAEKTLKDTSQVSKPETLRATFDALEKKPAYVELMGKSTPCKQMRQQGAAK